MIYYLVSESDNVYENLAMEEYLFRILPKGSRCLMLWQNRDAVVIGKYQNAAEEINSSYVREQGIRVARRLSGGGAVFHDLGNLNYSIIEDIDPDADTEKEWDFSAFLQPVIEVLRSYGLEAAFSGRNDIVIDDRKVSGCAQYERDGRILHHGCILVDTDLDRLEKALCPPAAKFESRSTKSVRSRVAAINSLLKDPIQIDDFKSELAALYLKEDGQQKGLIQERAGRLYLTEEDRREILRLRDEKYASWEWIWGYEAEYQVQKQRKYPAGLLKADMNVREGRIEKIRFSGDFFSSRDIHELEERLCGLKLDESLLYLLGQMDIAHHIHGITAGELCELLLE